MTLEKLLSLPSPSPAYEIRVSKADYALRVFPGMSERCARRKLREAILLDGELRRQLLRAGWSSKSHSFTCGQIRVLRRFGL